MNHEIRVFRRGAIYHVTNRTYRGELRLAPDDIVNMFAEGCLAKAARLYGVRIFAFILMGNHFHLLVAAPLHNLDRFMEYFQRELSWRLNRYRGTSGTNFPIRYQNEEIASAADFEQVVTRILSNPVRARLVGEAEQWPGISSLDQHRTGESRRTALHTTRANADEIARSGVTPELRRSLEPIELELSVPPFWDDLDPEEVHARIEQLVNAEQSRLRDEIETRNERVVGPNRILQETPDQRPEDVHWRDYRRVISENPEYEARYHAWYTEMRRRYWRSARNWRHERSWSDYPAGTFPPGWRRCVLPQRRTGPRLPWQPPGLRAA